MLVIMPVALLAVSLAGCSLATPEAPASTQSAAEVRDELISYMEDAAVLLEMEGWEAVPRIPDVEDCDEGYIRFSGWYATTDIPDTRVKTDDAELIAEYWESRGLTTVIKGDSDSRVVFVTKTATSPGLKFDTLGSYAFAGTTQCVPGDIDDFEDPSP